MLGLKHSTLKSKTDISLNLPNLKIYSHNFNDLDHNLALNCPKLEILDYLFIQTNPNYSIIHPESIKEVHGYSTKEFIFDLVNCEYL